MVQSYSCFHQNHHPQRQHRISSIINIHIDIDVNTICTLNTQVSNTLHNVSVTNLDSEITQVNMRTRNFWTVSHAVATDDAA